MIGSCPGLGRCQGLDKWEAGLEMQMMPSQAEATLLK